MTGWVTWQALQRRWEREAIARRLEQCKPFIEHLRRVVQEQKGRA